MSEEEKTLSFEERLQQVQEITGRIESGTLPLEDSVKEFELGMKILGGLTAELEGELADCYANTLTLCAENGLRSVAFCCISTGVFHFPNRRAAQIAVETVEGWLRAHRGQMDRVIFNVFKEEDRGYYEALIR